jgi:AraC-like DNA-binding protein
MATELMQDDRYSVSEIAEAVGLAPQNFARIFRRELGVTPLEYKRGKRNSENMSM